MIISGFITAKYHLEIKHRVKQMDPESTFNLSELMDTIAQEKELPPVRGLAIHQFKDTIKELKEDHLIRRGDRHFGIWIRC